MYIWLLNIYWSIFTIPNFPSQLQPISACECIILWVSETDPAVCYHKNSWSSNMRIPTSANLNMRTQTDFQTRPLIRIWLSKKRHSKTRPSIKFTWNPQTESCTANAQNRHFCRWFCACDHWLEDYSAPSVICEVVLKSQLALALASCSIPLLWWWVIAHVSDGINSRKRRDGALGSRGCFTLSSDPQYSFISLMATVRGISSE